MSVRLIQIIVIKMLRARTMLVLSNAIVTLDFTVTERIVTILMSASKIFLIIIKGILMQVMVVIRMLFVRISLVLINVIVRMGIMEMVLTVLMRVRNCMRLPFLTKKYFPNFQNDVIAYIKRI